MARVTINVIPFSHAPAGTSATKTIDAGAPYVLQVADFGFTDYGDIPRDTFTQVEVATLPTSGSLTLSGTPVTAGQFVSVADLSAGNLMYTPAASSSRPDFTFQVEDSGSTANGGANLDPVPKTLTFNFLPVAVDDSYTVNENQVLDQSDLSLPGVIGVLQNDTDADGDPLSAILVTNPQSGTLTLQSDGGFVYTPNTYFNGTDSFQYMANDGTVDSNVATVAIRVNHVSQAPTGTSSVVTILTSKPYVLPDGRFWFFRSE